MNNVISLIKKIIKKVVGKECIVISNLESESHARTNHRKREIIPDAKLGRQIISISDGSRFNLAGDFELFFHIVNDMHVNGGHLVPSGVWGEYSVNSEEMNTHKSLRDSISNIFLYKFSTMKLMMDPWVGMIGMLPVSEEQLPCYEALFKKIDRCGLVGDDLFTTAKRQGMLNTDLGSIMDVNLLANLTPLQNGKRYSVLEVGGGYGRLAEALTNALDCRFHYILVDAVPGSMLYAKEYLEKAFPNKKIGFYLNDEYDETYDFYILPPWQLSCLRKLSFDLCINVESMQEMVQEHVDYYLKLFDDHTKIDGTIYISNSRSYRFNGLWNFPEHWKLLTCHNTPRSWTSNHPTLFFKKTIENCVLHNQIITGLHVQQINDWNLRLKLAMA